MFKTDQKTFLHLDGDAFFVGVEIAKNSKLKNQPVVTGEEKGIVTALSYEAKALGVTRGMPVFRLKKQFPQVRILPGDYKSYVNYSGKMFEIVRRYVDEVEEYSIDECFGDLTGLDKTLKLSPLEVAQKIKNEIKRELSLSVSIGIGPTKILAKVASKWQKPDGLVLIESTKIRSYLETLDIGKVWGIGPRSADFLRKRGIKTALGFIDKSENWIVKNLSKPYLTIWSELRGLSLLSVDAGRKDSYDSIQKTRTFHPTSSDRKFLLSQLSKHVEDACLKARHYGLLAQKVSFFLKTQGFDFHAETIKLPSPTNAPEIINKKIAESFSKIFSPRIKYRTAGIVLNDLTKPERVQNDLFGDSEKARRFETIHEAIDKLEKKFGTRAIYLGSSDLAKKKKIKGTDADDLDRDLLFL